MVVDQCRHVQIISPLSNDNSTSIIEIVYYLMRVV